MFNSNLEDGILTKTTIVEIKMRIDNYQCLHTNILRIIRTDDSGNTVPKLTSQMFEEQDNMIVKVNEIEYPYRKIILEDRYMFQALPPFSQNEEYKQLLPQEELAVSNQTKQRPRTKIKRKPNIFERVSQDKHSQNKRTTKNIPKNFCKAFKNHYIPTLSKETQEWQVVCKAFRKIEEKTKCKYNNNFLHHLFSSHRLRGHFQLFLQNYATKWIDRSRVEDKQIHLQGIEIYLNKIKELTKAQKEDLSLSNE